MLDEWLLHLCSVEVVILKHPTFFHKAYMSGVVTLVSAFGVTETKQITADDEVFSPYLEGVYINRDTMDASIFRSLTHYCLIYWIS